MDSFDRIDDWAAALDNRAAVPGHEACFAGWRRDAATYRAHRAPQTLSYGAQAREVFDLWMPDGAAKGLFVFIHGGWWMNFDKDCFSHVAAGPRAHGWAVAIPSYTLLPAITLTALVAQARGAVNAIARAVPDVPMVVGGHSAGGHLAAMTGTPVAAPEDAVQTRVRRILSISGVHDLRPLPGLPINDTLRISDVETRTLSPALHRPLPGFDLVAWAGADELPEFRRQNALLAVAWGGCTATRAIDAPGLDHFTAFAPLADPDSDLTALAVRAV